MRMPSWVSVSNCTAALLFACCIAPALGFQADDTVALPGGGRVQWTPGPQKTELRFSTPESKSEQSISLNRDATANADSPRTKLKVVGDIPGKAVILMDSYGSVPGGLAYCRAGTESFLRVISIAEPRPKETLSLKVASCRQNLELADNGVQWDAANHTLHIQWLSGPGGPGKPGRRTFHITADGQIAK